MPIAIDGGHVDQFVPKAGYTHERDDPLLYQGPKKPGKAIFRALAVVGAVVSVFVAEYLVSSASLRRLVCSVTRRVDSKCPCSMRLASVQEGFAGHVVSRRSLA